MFGAFMFSQIAGAVALSVAAAVLPSGAMPTTSEPDPTATLVGGAAASASADASADQNRNRYCDSLDPRPPSEPGPTLELGNGLTAKVNTDIETVSVRSEAGPTWDSTITSVDRYGIGAGWTLGEAFIEFAPYPKVYVPGHGLLESDWSRVSGLLCYDGRDVLFSAAAGTVPARGEFPERAYEYSLLHFDQDDLDTPVRTDYFDANGEVMTMIAADGSRTDRVYDPNRPERLTRIVHDDGRETTITSPVEYVDSRLIITPPDGTTTTFDLGPWLGPVDINGPTGSSSITWTSMGPMHNLVSTNVGDGSTRFTEFDWSPDDTGRLLGLRLDGEQVFPE